MDVLDTLRDKILALNAADEVDVIRSLKAKYSISDTQRQAFTHHSIQLINNIRKDKNPSLMDVFLSEYGLSTDEGVALMCLAEALLRIPDEDTMDKIIADKIAPSSWGEHLGKSSSSLVNASTWALMLTGKVLNTDKTPSVANILHGTIKRLGEPVIRAAVKRSMEKMGEQFVLGESIEDAISRGASERKTGATYSYDMLGEAAKTEQDAIKYFEAYWNAINQLSNHAVSSDIKDNPGISIKLSALHPRYELTKRSRVLSELTERTLSLCVAAKAAKIGLNIDAEESDRLDLSLDIIEAVLSSPKLADWDGFGVVVQAYNKRCSVVLDWLYALSKKLDRKIMVRLVKGAYWDTEVKRAQVEGLETYPVYTQKSATDISYICCAKQLLGMTDRIYPQFATHNAHSMAAILELKSDNSTYEFQRLHGMGSLLHQQVMARENTNGRIYAPVGAHEDLLAYLVRRLLENGANSSFVNQIVDEDMSAEEIAADPFSQWEDDISNPLKKMALPCDIFEPQRHNSKGWDMHDVVHLAEIEAARAPFKSARWTVTPILKGKSKGGPVETIINPAHPNESLGTITLASIEDVNKAIKWARPWSGSTALERAVILKKAADLFENNFGQIFAILIREAGKVTADAIDELREAVDFLRYYAHQAILIDNSQATRKARGIISCISPWNFPLAIFTGQIAAALAAGNGVLAKPAETTPIIASLTIKLLHEAGVPKDVLQFLPGSGRTIGASMTSNIKIDGVCFTGSTATAKTIHKSMADHLSPYAPLIAETGGLNAMIVDSTALHEQAVTDVVASAFQSAGQRCSALRILYLQADIAPKFMKMLTGALAEQTLGDPWDFSTDIGPVITEKAQLDIQDYIEQAKNDGRLIRTLQTPSIGHFIGPTLISIGSILEMEQEVFGPVLHIATFEANELPKVIADINQSGYGLTFGLHTRIDQRVEEITQRLNVGNVYVNRNQIGAVVGSQPFGGEGLSGTGPKAGGPSYVKRFTCKDRVLSDTKMPETYLPDQDLQEHISNAPRAKRLALSTRDLLGPTGESNRLSEYPRGTILCLGPSLADADKQAEIAQSKGCTAIKLCREAQGDGAINGTMNPNALEHLTDIDGVAFWGDIEYGQRLRQALARRTGKILPLMSYHDMADLCVIERHICIDTTASGGNADLLAGY